MKAIDLIFRETLTSGQFEMKSHVLVFIDEAGNEYSDTFSEVRHNGRFEGFILPYYVSTMEGTKYPVNVEEMYIYCDEWDEFYNETVAKVAQAILEAEQIKEA